MSPDEERRGPEPDGEAYPLREREPPVDPTDAVSAEKLHEEAPDAVEGDIEPGNDCLMPGAGDQVEDSREDEKKERGEELHRKARD